MPVRRTEPEARVMVFIDGQNVFKTCERVFGRGLVHPCLLGTLLAKDRKVVGIRYYSGIHDPRKEPQLNAAANRRHALIRRTGVTVVERTLRYRWDWGIDITALGDPSSHQGSPPNVTATPFERPREKRDRPRTCPRRGRPGAARLDGRRDHRLLGQ